MSFLLLFAVFASGVLGSSALPRVLGRHVTQPVNARPYFDLSSEILVKNSVDARLMAVRRHTTGFMFRVPDDPRFLDVDRPARFRPDWQPSAEVLDRSVSNVYASQLGLQARSYAFVAGLLDLSRPRTFAVLSALCAAALAAALAQLIVFMRNAWGSAAAASMAAFSLLSTGFNLFSTSLYWSTFLHVAPTAVVAAAAPRLREMSGARRLLVWIAVGACFVAKFLSGFELMSVTISAAALPFRVLVAARRRRLRETDRCAALVCAVGAVSFAVAVGIYDVLYREAFGTGGLAYLAGRSNHWIASSAGAAGPIGQAVRVLATNSVDVAGYGLPTALALLPGMLLVFLALRGGLASRLEDVGARTALVGAAALCASASWLLLQPKHLLFHPRYATILVAFPYGMFASAAVARLWALRTASPAGAGAPAAPRSLA